MSGLINEWSADFFLFWQSYLIGLVSYHSGLDFKFWPELSFHFVHIMLCSLYSFHRSIISTRIVSRMGYDCDYSWI